MKKIFNIGVLVFLTLALFSCNTTKRAEKRIHRILENHQELIQKDTVTIDTTFNVSPNTDSAIFSLEDVADGPEVIRTDHGKFVITSLPSRKIQIDYLPDSMEVHFRTEVAHDKIVIHEHTSGWRKVLLYIIFGFVGFLLIRLFFERLKNRYK